MKYLNIHKNKVKFSNPETDKKKSRFRKWFYRIMFLILLLLLLLMFHHFELAIEALRHINSDQMNLINELGSKVHSLELHNANLQIQADMMKLKINGLEIQNMHNQVHNITQQPVIHNSIPHIDSNVNTVHTHSNIHNGNSLIAPVGMLTTTAITVYAIFKAITGVVPALP